MSATTRRQDAPVDVWRKAAPPARLGDERLRFTTGAREPLGDVLTAVSWDDVTMELTGALQASVPLSTLNLSNGTKIMCEYAASESAAFKPLWTMGLGEGDQVTHGLQDDSLSGTLGSLLGRYRGTTMDFSFRKDKAHPKGWTCDQITVEVGRRTGMPLGKIARGTHRILSLVRRKADPVDVILVAYKMEREANGTRFFGQWNGKLSITPLMRSDLLLEVMPVLLDGTYTTERRSDFATVLNVRATAKTGARKTRKIRVRVQDKAAVKQFGVVSKTVSPKGIETEQQARDWAHASLARRLAPKRTMEIVVPLMPTIKRGDALMVEWAAAGLRQVVFVRSASHEWSSSGGSTTLTLRFDDPFLTDKQKREAAAKAAKGKTVNVLTFEQPTVAGRRGDA